MVYIPSLASSSLWSTTPASSCPWSPNLVVYIPSLTSSRLWRTTPTSRSKTEPSQQQVLAYSLLVNPSPASSSSVYNPSLASSSSSSCPWSTTPASSCLRSTTPPSNDGREYAAFPEGCECDAFLEGEEDQQQHVVYNPLQQLYVVYNPS